MTIRVFRRHLVLGMGAVLLSACSVARSAPSRRELLASGTEDVDFALELVARDRLPLYHAWGGSNGRSRTAWPNGGATPGDQRLAPGDQLSLRIWDAEQSSLITAPNAQFADVTNVVVSASGHVSLPYIDDVRVGGLTLAAARLSLQDSLTGIIPSAQVQIAVEQGRRNSVALLGGVQTPGTYPLTERNLPLTSLIASAGGVRPTLPNPQVQITRGSHVYRRSLEFVLASPSNDPALQGGDRVMIEADPRRFLALGATGRQEVITFDAEEVTALRALSLMGGLADNRADPRGILVLRRYSEDSVARPDGPPNTRVVFSFDLTNADSVFSADEFHLQDGDVVLATQAPAVTTQRALGLFGSVLGIATRVNDI